MVRWRLVLRERPWQLGLVTCSFRLLKIQKGHVVLGQMWGTV